jgi:hypothetical protein
LISRTYVRRVISAIRFLRRRDDCEPAAAWWAAVADCPHGGPGIVRELLLSRSVACDAAEAEQALAWARAQPAWIDDPARSGRRTRTMARAEKR